MKGGGGEGRGNEMGKICEGGRGVEMRGVRDVKRRVQEKGKRGRKERGGDRKIMEREGDFFFFYFVTSTKGEYPA